MLEVHISDNRGGENILLKVFLILSNAKGIRVTRKNELSFTSKLYGSAV